MIEPRFKQEQRALDSLVARGIVSQPQDDSEGDKPAHIEAVAAALTQREEPAPDSTSAAQDSPDATPNLPMDLRVPLSPFGYRLPGVEAQHHEDARMVGEWMQTAGLTVSEGRSVAEAAVRAAAKPMSEVELRIATRNLHDGLRQRWGADYEANIGLAKAELDRIDKQHGGKLMAWLDDHVEVLTDPHVIKSLVHRALRKKTK